MDKLLIVEDSKSFGSAFKRRIEERTDFEVRWATNFAEAETLVNEQGDQFFMAVLDLQLPDAPDGEIVDYIRQKKIPAVVFTGILDDNMRERMQSKKILDYFIKEDQETTDHVISFIERYRSNSNKKILVVDDSLSAREHISWVLSRHNYVALQASGGKEAMEILKQHKGIRLAIVDYNMPEMDGFQLTKLIRRHYARNELAIMGISIYGNNILSAKFIKHGANDFINKPFLIEELLSRVAQNVDLVDHIVTLKEQQEQLSAILNTSLDAILTIDRHGIIVESNPAADALFGYPKNSLKGQELGAKIVPQAYRNQHREALARYAQSADITSPPKIKRRFEVQGLRSDGSLIDLEVALVSVVHHGELLFTGFLKDITAKKQYITSLRETLEVAESASRAKSEFLANMSHEIRSPMNAIIGMTDLVLNTPLSQEEQRTNLEIVQQSSYSLLELINTVLDLSKIEADQLNLERIDFDLWAETEKACNALAIKAHTKRLELDLHIDHDLPRRVMGDPLRLRQILINLLGNAIKFTEEGSVSLVVQSLGASDDGVQVRFSVHDTGIGIPRNHQKTVFEEFHQGGAFISRKYGGTGLGLSISRRLAERMGGE
ncbi:MAG: response regulator, partial [Magnetococcales bacterium]|nr:response regulator [Magnetococcales bacterium]